MSQISTAGFHTSEHISNFYDKNWFASVKATPTMCTQSLQLIRKCLFFSLSDVKQKQSSVKSETIERRAFRAD